LRWRKSWPGGPIRPGWYQITRASSANAAARRESEGTSVPRSWKPLRTFWTKAWLATMTLAVRSRFSARIGRTRALSRPWSVSSALFACTSVSWKAPGRHLVEDASIEAVPIGGDLHGRDPGPANRSLEEAAGCLGVPAR
jgi:hypothetical protein